MKTYFVVRLLDRIDVNVPISEQKLLGWTKIAAEARPQEGRASCPFWATEPTKFQIERDGVATYIVVHWPDLDIARIQKIDGEVEVKAGQVFDWLWLEPVWLTAGMKDVPMPAVTVRAPVAIGVPAGGLNARSPR